MKFELDSYVVGANLFAKKKLLEHQQCLEAGQPLFAAEAAPTGFSSTWLKPGGNQLEKM
ncbi:MAG: hypothetical protein OEY01_02950 [Desulfobulbaceae bacterium]|nr:hypothetical protein [Desulfobulbaceae bacterium]